jgi:hypothetical protein
MTQTSFRRSFIVALVMAGSTAMLAQSGSLTYDRAAETIIAGKVLHVVPFAAPDGGVGVHFDLQGPGGLINVHVAPAIYMGQQNIAFFSDDEVEITGVKVDQDGNKAFVARIVKRGDKTFTMRTDEGKPSWTPQIEGTDGCGVNHPALPRGTEL